MIPVANDPTADQAAATTFGLVFLGREAEAHDLVAHIRQTRGKAALTTMAVRLSQAILLAGLLPSPPYEVQGGDSTSRDAAEIGTAILGATATGDHTGTQLLGVACTTDQMLDATWWLVTFASAALGFHGCDTTRDGL
jgi:hypothetical protein